MAGYFPYLAEVKEDLARKADLDFQKCFSDDKIAEVIYKSNEIRSEVLSEDSEF